MSRVERVRSRIPAFDSLEEEAEFWDTHSLAEFEDELEPVEVEVAHPLGHVISVRLEGDAFHRLDAVAQRRGVSVFALAEQWLLEGLARADAAGAGAAEPDAGR